MVFEKLKEEAEDAANRTVNEEYAFRKVRRQRMPSDRYTMNYRVVKTFLLIFTMISFGLNFELIGPTLEDLKIFLNVNYSSISFGLVLRNIGYLTVTILLGLTLDRMLKYSELCLALSSAIVFITSLFIPVTQTYTLSMMYFLCQGISQSMYDLIANSMILNLWSRINASPINAMHGGYGIGAIFATQISRPFLSFDPLKTPILEKTNNPVENPMDSKLKILIFGPNVTFRDANSDHIDLKVPYWIGAFTSLSLVFLFIAAQLYENKNTRIYEENKKKFILLENESDNENHESGTNVNKPKKEISFMRKLIFGEENKKKETLYLTAQILLFFLVFVFIQGYITVISRFLLTYLTKGPGKFDTQTFAKIQTIFWSFFIFSRFLATYLTFKIDSVKFFLSLLILNSFVCFTFLIPYLTSFKWFFWISVSCLGLTAGPMVPSGLMIAKRILDFSSFVLSVFIVGLASGGIIFQQITGHLLDYFDNRNEWLGFKKTNSSYIIPHLLFFASFLALLFFLPIFILHTKYKRPN